MNLPGAIRFAALDAGISAISGTELAIGLTTFSVDLDMGSYSFNSSLGIYYAGCSGIFYLNRLQNIKLFIRTV